MMKDNFFFQKILLNKFSLIFCIVKSDTMLFSSFLHQPNYKLILNLHPNTKKVGFLNVYVNVNRFSILFVMFMFVCLVRVCIVTDIGFYDDLDGAVAILCYHMFQIQNFVHCISLAFTLHFINYHVGNNQLDFSFLNKYIYYKSTRLKKSKWLRMINRKYENYTAIILFTQKILLYTKNYLLRCLKWRIH